MEIINPKIKNLFLSMIFLNQLSQMKSKSDKDKEKEADAAVFIRKCYNKEDAKKFGTSIANMNLTKRSKILLLQKSHPNNDTPIKTPPETKHTSFYSITSTKTKEKIYLKTEGNISNVSSANSKRDTLDTYPSSRTKLNISNKEEEAAAVIATPFQCDQSNKREKRKNKSNTNINMNRFLTKMSILSKFQNIETKKILTQRFEKRKKDKIYLPPIIKSKVTIEYVDC